MGRNERQRTAQMCMTAINRQAHDVAIKAVDEAIWEREARENRKFNQLVAQGVFIEENDDKD